MKKSMSRKRRMFLALQYVLLILLSIFFAFPFVWTLSTAFKGAGEAFGMHAKWIPEHPTFDNFKYVFKNFPMMRYFLNTLIITFAGVFLNVILAALAGYPLARLKFKGRKLLFAIILFPMMVPMQSNIIVNFITVNKLGLFNTYTSVFITSAVSIFGIFLLKQHYESIPKELEDAARIDGCNEFQVWWKIMLPMIKPATATLSIMSFVIYWNYFLWPLIVLKDSDKYPLQVGLAYLNGLFERNFRHISASIVIATIPIMIFFFFTQRYFIEGYQGAVKQ